MIAQIQLLRTLRSEGIIIPTELPETKSNSFPHLSPEARFASFGLSGLTMLNNFSPKMGYSLRKFFSMWPIFPGPLDLSNKENLNILLHFSIANHKDGYPYPLRMLVNRIFEPFFAGDIYPEEILKCLEILCKVELLTKDEIDWATEFSEKNTRIGFQEPNEMLLQRISSETSSSNSAVVEFNKNL